MPKLQIQIVNWNHRRFLPKLFESLREQTFKDFDLLLIDNASSDDSIAYVREHFPEVMILKNSRNIGFAPAHNQGMALALKKWGQEAPEHAYVFVYNPDIIAPPTFVADLVKFADAHPEAGAVGGKLLKIFEEQNIDFEGTETVRSEIIDTTGIRMAKNGRVTERGAGETDTNQFSEGEVFGISGAAVLLRVSALASVAFENEIFDADFHSYKEDIDLAWRLSRAGWKSLYTPSAVAYHYRGVYGKEKTSWFAMLKNRKKRAPFVSFVSYRNHLLMLMKNLSFVDFLKRAPWLVPYEIGKGLVMLFTEPLTFFKSWFSILGLSPRMMRKRYVKLYARR